MRENLNNLKRELNTGGWRGGVEFFSRLAHRKLLAEESGMPIWDREWDVLILLDACRYDLMESIYNEFDFLQTLEQHRSVGSHSKEWMERTFNSEFTAEMQSTTYVSANPFTNEVLSESQFERLEEVWRYGWDSDYGTIPPRPVTDTAITVGRKDDWKQLIVHYMQPHVPFLEYTDGDITYEEFNNMMKGRGDDNWNETLNRFQRREVSREEFWKRYQSNLRFVLDDIYLLLQNINADTVAISADHGNAIGERWLYGHPSGVDLPCLRLVPWTTTTATDEGEYTPSEYEQKSKSDVEEQLSALGYR